MHSHPSLDTFQAETKKIIDHLKNEFSKLQTGRANSALVEHIMIDAYGQKMDLRSVGSISVQDAKSIVIQPWDKSVLASIEKAIQQADLGVNPVNDGMVIRLNFPPMTEERRVHLKKVVGQLSEQAKISVRKSRQETNDVLKEVGGEDVKERGQKELQKMVDEANAAVEQAAKQKEQEIMTI